MIESAVPRDHERFLDVRFAVQNERHQLCGMIEGGLTSPLPFHSLPFGYRGWYQFLKAGQPPMA
jgi:hypothetical protein